MANVDPSTGMFLDPNTGQVMDPAAAAALHLQMGLQMPQFSPGMNNQGYGYDPNNAWGNVQMEGMDGSGKAKKVKKNKKEKKLKKEKKGKKEKKRKRLKKNCLRFYIVCIL